MAERSGPQPQGGEGVLEGERHLGEGGEQISERGGSALETEGSEGDGKTSHSLLRLRC